MTTGEPGDMRGVVRQLVLTHPALGQECVDIWLPSPRGALNGSWLHQLRERSAG
jgi:hypothetical protein